MLAARKGIGILWFTLFCLLIEVQGVHAQSYQVSGKVTDAVTDEAIPFTNIFFKGSKAGVTTGFDGKI